MPLGLLNLHLQIPGCTSLKEKRRRLKPLIIRLHKEFNISVAEMLYQDRWDETLLACALVSSDHGHTLRLLGEVTQWVEINWPDVYVIDDQIEMI